MCSEGYELLRLKLMIVYEQTHVQFLHYSLFVLKMEIECSSDTFLLSTKLNNVRFQKTYLHSHCRENL
jgi:hypothetical protein